MASFDSKYSLEPDHIFEGRYRIVRELGSGGFGVVYLAHQIAMDRPVALKILKPGVGAHAPSARERFLREVRIISKLRHPNTVTIHDYGETIHGIVYMVLEYVEGRTLKQMLRREGAQEPLRALAIARQIARSLGEAHNHQVVHRDLKPANIMLSNLEGDGDFVKVLDFGVARLLDSPEDADLTSAGVPEGERALIGTPRYMSPEQVRGENLTGASDLYSLGLIIYEMLIGEPAVQGDTTMGLISQQLSPEPLQLPSLQALPESLRQLLRRATAKSIGQRFRSADEFARALDETALTLSENMGAGGRAAKGAYFATSGRFPAISSSQIMQAPSARLGPDATAAATPAGTQRRTFSNQAAAGLAVGASPDASLDYYESNFDEQQLLERSQSLARESVPEAGFPFVGNQIEVDEPEEICGIPASELPLPPDAGGSPFAQPEPVELEEPAPAPPQKTMHHEVEEESLFGFGFAVIKACFLSVVALFFLYSCFLIAAALVGEFTEGTIRLAIAASLAISIPLFTALGENSQKERFEVVKRPMDRLVRVLIGSTIFSAATIVIIGFAMPGQVTDHLRNDPNWMFRTTPGVEYEPTAWTATNNKLSHVLADMIEVSTVYIGRYDGTPTSAQNSAPVPTTTPTTVPSTRPQPTRPGTRDSAATAEPESDSRADAESVTETESQAPPSTRRGPPPTRPSNDSESGSDYVRWE